MYKPKTITLQSMVGIEQMVFTLELKGNVTVILGDSGSGRTLLCEVALYCRDAYREQFGGQIRVYNYRNYNTLDDFLSDVHKREHNGLIMVDNADCFLTTQQMQTMVQDLNNHYILMKRDLGNVPLSPNYLATLYKDAEGVFRLRHEFTNPRWFA